jgi:DNA-binding PadR family transcriptional regulator
VTQGEAIILRILASGDRHAYALDRLFDENRMREWADIGFSSIYSTLGKLERKELVRSRMEPEQAGPARRVYSLTAKGRAEVRREIVRLLEGGDSEPKDLTTVGLILSSFLGERDFEASLARRRTGLVRRLEFLRDPEIPETARGRDRIRLAFQRQRALVQAEVAWLDDVIGETVRGPGEDPGATKPR